MKIWEIVKGMTDNKYKSGDMFQNADLGDMIITKEKELAWADSLEPVIMLIGDDVEWEEV